MEKNVQRGQDNKKSIFDRVKDEFSIENKLKDIISNWDYEMWLFDNKEQIVLSSLGAIKKEEEFSVLKKQILDKIDDDIDKISENFPTEEKQKEQLEEFKKKVKEMGNDEVKVV